MEKRKYTRRKSRFLVQLEGDDFQIYTNATDIGPGGAFVNTLYLLTVGTALNLKLQVPDSENTVDVEGTVVRQVTDVEREPAMDHIGMAIQFTNMSSEKQAAIESLVHHP